MLAAERTFAVPHELMKRFSDARLRSDALLDLVRPGSLYERPIPERHRIVFYLGHLEAFDWNLLRETVGGPRAASAELDRLFAFGIDPVGGGLPTDQPSDWPSEGVVRDYVKGVRNALDHNLGKALLEQEGVTRNGFPLRTLLNAAIEHRLMHVETLAYMLHQLPFSGKIRREEPAHRLNAPSWPVAHRPVEIPDGPIEQGLRRSAESFGWDNEYEAHTVEVPSFEIDQYKVTNRQYLNFVAAGGYETRALWNDDDWNWKSTNAIAHPLFWRKENGGWRWRGMFEDVPLPLDWPVYVSHAEASAYANWAGKSLPTEAEWQRAAYGTVDGSPRRYPWGNRAPESEFHEKFGNFDFRRWDPVPVNAFPESQSAFGVHDMLGNGWEWTSTIFGPFAGFEPFLFYRGYSADFFDGKHYVMKGGSARTAACMLRPMFRNWFQSHYQYVYSGFRCVSR
jgi:iron(II)-dependent oxidoreductase